MICHRDIKPENLLVIDMLHSKVVKYLCSTLPQFCKYYSLSPSLWNLPTSGWRWRCGSRCSRCAAPRPTWRRRYSRRPDTGSRWRQYQGVAPYRPFADPSVYFQVDVWAVGVILYILLCGYPPFSSRTNNQEELFDQILSGLFEFNSPDWDDISYPAKELISWSLVVDPLQRYSAKEILQHPWIVSADSTAQWRTELPQYYLDKLPSQQTIGLGTRL